MKKHRIILMTLIAVLGTSNVSAQSWLKKAMKKVDKVMETVDNTLGEKTNVTEEKIDPVQETETIELGKYHYVPAFQSIGGTTTNKDMIVRFISCIRYDKSVIVEFEITNNSEYDIELYRIAGFGNRSAITDNIGTNHAISNANIGGKAPMYGDLAVTKFPIFSETSVIGSVVVNSVSKSANSFPLFRIGFTDNNTQYNFQFKKVPIINQSQILELEEVYQQKVATQQNNN